LRLREIAWGIWKLARGGGVRYSFSAIRHRLIGFRSNNQDAIPDLQAIQNWL
jgi:hypothetical protein